MERVRNVDIQKAIVIHAVTNGDSTKGWIHTHGMQAFDKPELEIRDIPLFMSGYAMMLLNSLADYMINYDAEVLPGQRLGGFTPVNFKVVNPHPIEGDEEHYAYPVLQLVDLDEIPCPCCEVDKVLKEAVEKINGEA